jgi:hypothetical protein
MSMGDQEKLFDEKTEIKYLVILFFETVLRIRIRMNPHGFGLQDPHPESAFQMRIPDADADSD